MWHECQADLLLWIFFSVMVSLFLVNEGLSQYFNLSLIFRGYNLAILHFFGHSIGKYMLTIQGGEGEVLNGFLQI